MSTSATTTPPAARPGPSTTLPPDAGTPTRVWLVASLTVAALELIRASGPLLDHAFAIGTLTAAATAVGTYAAAGLVALVVLLATGRSDGVPSGSTVLGGATLFAIGRVLLQAVQGDARYWLGLVVVAVAVGTLALAVAFVAGRPQGGRQASLGLLVGLALSAGLQLALGTWDALWRDSWIGWLVAGVVALAPLLAARAATPSRGAGTLSTGRPRRLWGLGPFLALAAMVGANPAFAASQSGVPLGIAGLVVVVALSVGGWLVLRPDAWPGAVRIAASVLVVLSVAGAMWLTGVGALVAIAVFDVAVGIVASAALATHRPAPPGLARTVGAVAVVGLGVVGPLLLYMLDYDVPLPVDNAWVVVLAAVVVAGTGLRHRTPRPAAQATAQPAAQAAARATSAADGPASTPASGTERANGRMPARVNAVRWLLVPAVVLALVGLVPSTTSAHGADVPAKASSSGPLTIVDWNLHYGVAPALAVDLEGIARTIEAQDPDVVTLQEVERGWIFGGGADTATWLAHRLGMTIRFAPAADRQFGNAVLARSGLTDVEVHPLPYGAGPQQRSAIGATLTLDDGSTVRVISVHLQHRESNTPTRLDQLEALEQVEPASVPAVLAGDFNAEPGWPEIDLLEGQGWVSAIDTVGDPAALTSPSDVPAHRIDWIFGQGVTFESATVLTAQQSDHRPLVATFTPQP